MTKTLLTYRDLLETPDDGRRYELIEGEVIVSPAPDGEHQIALKRFVKLLLRAEAAGYGRAYFAPLDIVFDEAEHNTAQPDAFFLHRDNPHRVTRVLRGAPDLVIEVLSPSTRAYDLRAKRQLYARFGVRYYWAGDPKAETVQAFDLAGEDYEPPRVLSGSDVLGCPLFPDITMTVAEIFAPE
ncbi:MAG TPA: Uma2 family endonuclease [Thermomicrobiales bacterium]|nr:Uma2 family endonuclease [Thermomicrobiales bacterium]